MAKKVELVVAIKPEIDSSALSASTAIIQQSFTTTALVVPARAAVDSASFKGLADTTEKAGSDAGKSFSSRFSETMKSGIKGAESSLNSALSPILSVFGGNILTKGFTAITGGFGDWIEKGKGVLATSQAMTMAFAQTGLSGDKLQGAISSTNKVAGSLANKFAMSVADVREYSKAAAILGGATGKQNEELTKLGIAIEKSTNGMVSGSMAIRLFSKGVSDPESEFALARLTKQYPALGAALKGIKEPAEVTQKALQFFAPTFKTMEENAGGALGSFTIMQNSLNAVKTAFGSVIIEAVAPFAASFSQTIVPAISAFTGYVKSATVLVKPLAPVFTAVGVAAAGLAGGLLTLSGVRWAQGLIEDGAKLALTITQKVLPSLILEEEATGKLLLNKELLNAENLKQSALNAKDAIYSAAKSGWNALESATTGTLASAKGLLTASTEASTVATVEENAAQASGGAWLAIKTAGTTAYAFAKSALVAATEFLTLANIKEIAGTALSTAWTIAKTAALAPLTAAQWALNVAMDANPATLWAVGIAAAVGAIYLLYDNVASVRDLIDGAWTIIKFGAQTAWEVIKSGASIIGSAFSLVGNIIITPFKLVYSVVSTVFERIGSVVSSMLDASASTTSALTVIQNIGSFLITTFDKVSAFIGAISTGLSSLTESLGGAIGSLLTLDLGGFVDGISGMFGKAAEDSNQEFTKKVRESNWSEAKKSIELAFNSGTEIQAKVKANADFSDAVKQYESYSQKIQELSSLKASGNITADQETQLQAAKEAVAKYGAEIEKIAPGAVNSFSTIKDSAGNLIQTYDINIAKAKEFSKASDVTDALNVQKDAYTRSIGSMSSTFSAQTAEVKRLQGELSKPVKDQETYDKLRKNFDEAKAKAEEMKNQLIDTFTKGGEAGLITDQAVNSVAKSLGITNQQAREMMLEKELKKVAASGVYTERQILEIANKYGVSRDRALELFEATKKNAKEVQKTEENVKSLAEAWKKVESAMKSAAETSSSEYTLAKLYIQNLKDRPALAKKMYETQDSEGKKMLDRIRNMNAQEQSDYLRNLLNKGKAEHEANEQLSKDAKKAQEDITGKNKDSEKSAKSAAKEQKSQYDILRDSHKAAMEALDAEIKGEKTKREGRYLSLKYTVSEQQATKDRLSDIIKEQSAITQKQALYKEELAAAQKLTDKDGKRQKAINDVKKDMDTLIAKSQELDNETKSLNIKLEVQDDKFKEDLEKVKSDAKRKAIEIDVKLGRANEKDLINFDVALNESKKDDLLKEIEKTKLQIDELKNADPTIDTSALQKQIEDYKLQVMSAEYDINNSKKQLAEKAEAERLASISDAVEREKETTVSTAKKKYDEDLILYRDNLAAKLVAESNYQKAVADAEQKYLLSKSATYSALSKFSDSFSNMQVGIIDKSASKQAKANKQKVEDEKKSLQSQLAQGKIEYEKYDEQLRDLKQKSADADVALAKANADAQSAVWNDFRKTLVSALGGAYDEYYKKFKENSDKIILGIGDQTEATKEMYNNLAAASTVMLAQMVADNKSFSKSILDTAFAAARAMVPVLVVEILGREFIKSGLPGALAAAGMTAALYTTLAVAQSAVSGAFKDGVVGFRGKGTATSDDNLVRISNGESVIPTSGTEKNRGLLNHIVNSGGDLFSYIRANPDIQTKLAQERLIGMRDNAMRNQEFLRPIIVEHKEKESGEVAKLKDQIKSLEKTIITMQDTLVKTLNNTKLVERKEAFQVNVQNKVVQKIEKEAWRF